MTINQKLYWLGNNFRGLAISAIFVFSIPLMNMDETVFIDWLTALPIVFLIHLVTLTAKKFNLIKNRLVAFIFGVITMVVILNLIGNAIKDFPITGDQGYRAGQATLLGTLMLGVWVSGIYESVSSFDYIEWFNKRLMKIKDCSKSKYIDRQVKLKLEKIEIDKTISLKVKEALESKKQG